MSVGATGYELEYMTPEDFELACIRGDVVRRDRVSPIGYVQKWDGMIAYYPAGTFHERKEMYIWRADKPYPGWRELRIGARPGPETKRAPERAKDRPTKGGNGK